MPDVTMWWARTDWFYNTPAGLAITPRPNGLELAGNLWGPVTPDGSLLDRMYRVRIVSWYWLGTDRMPATGSAWHSRAIDRTQGLIVGSTYGDAWPWAFPRTTLFRHTRHRVFAGSTVIASEQRTDELVWIFDTAYTSQAAALPRFGVFWGISSQTFELDRTQGLAIEVEFEYVVSFRGDGRLRFDNVLVSVPQFDIHSTA
jgi:hypothetical protein